MDGKTFANVLAVVGKYRRQTAVFVFGDDMRRSVGANTRKTATMWLLSLFSNIFRQSYAEFNLKVIANQENITFLSKSIVFFK